MPCWVLLGLSRPILASLWAPYGSVLLPLDSLGAHVPSYSQLDAHALFNSFVGSPAPILGQVGDVFWDLRVVLLLPTYAPSALARCNVPEQLNVCQEVVICIFLNTDIPFFHAQGHCSYSRRFFHNFLALLWIVIARSDLQAAVGCEKALIWSTGTVRQAGVEICIYM